ncbi:hypothetical protein FOIG_10670 [Fusarium odoratissimum NRRL 54006]|uniref:Uncharacterized protein n=2 Tax=Fusarium oxysporum species complex TaxID=171631 RepID=X0J6S2_FUSO5|nr:uncharacterized protein FOIG_10670 [Fusarium odoratissimum NRRL 54006]EXL96898.1 hypothetical protein FOIG_10670 [Fusarium odoratissimum NRRL 54006]TXC00668.1 hypothetical protein FocTR4_00008889 [Fusarium oxysporum f. sp. cubense]
MNFHFANPRDEQKQSLFFRLPREIHADIITICVPTSWQRFNKYHQDEDQKPLRLIKAERCLPVLFSTCQEMLARAPYDISTQAYLAWAAPIPPSISCHGAYHMAPYINPVWPWEVLAFGHVRNNVFRKDCRGKVQPVILNLQFLENHLHS